MEQKNKSQKKELPKSLASSYDPNAVEAGWYEWWVNQGYFKADANSTKEKFVMVIPPPNVTGRLHIGHALMTAVEDSIIRYHRMSGREALWVPGTDHAGIATQVVVEKKLMKEKKLSRHDLGREKFIEEVWKWKESFGNTILSQLRSLGASVDWTREEFTMNEKLSRAVNEAFIRMHNRNLIFRSTRLVNWCCALNSTISNIEVDYQELKGKTNLTVPGYAKPIPFGVLTEFAYKIVDSTEEVVVATTRPETMLGDTAIAIHPEDSRYTHLHGKFVQHPFLDRKIPIVLDAVLVDKEFGTGCVKITPAHDPNDFECGKRHKLEYINILNDDGTLNHNCGQFAGMKRFDARLAVLNALKTLNLFKGQKDNPMSIARCSRSTDVIEPILKPQWYVNTVEAAARSIEKVQSKELKIHPEIFVPVWENWLKNPENWCISRQLWWGHTIPAYYVSIENHPSSLEELPEHWVVGRDENEARVAAQKKFPELANAKFTLRRDPDVLDTWFSSSLFPFSVFGWPDENSADLKKFFPTSLLETGHDIIFFWVAKMVMNSLVLNDCLPFTDIFLHAVVRDADGEKMSKSTGNVIDPIDVIKGATLEKLNSTLADANLNEKDLKKALETQKRLFPTGIEECGTDALRFALCDYTRQPRDINLNIQRVTTYRRFCNKLWNTTNFVLNYGGIGAATSEAGAGAGAAATSEPFVPLNSNQFHTFKPKHDPMAQWILSKLDYAVKVSNQGFLTYKLFEATEAIHYFMLEQFCDVYLESTKRHLRSTETPLELRKEIQHTLYICMHVGLRLFHPFMPFTTEELYQYLPRPKEEPESICISPFPTSEKDTGSWSNTALEQEVETVLSLCNAIRSIRATYNIPKSQRPDVFLDVNVPQTDAFTALVSKYIHIIGDLSFTVDTVYYNKDIPKKECSRIAVGDYIVYLKMTGLGIDFEAEKKRIEKKVGELKKQKEALQKKMKLLDPSKVPESVRTKNEESLSTFVVEIDVLEKKALEYATIKSEDKSNNNTNQ